jgi:hypothetical protein
VRLTVERRPFADEVECGDEIRENFVAPLMRFERNERLYAAEDLAYCFARFVLASFVSETTTHYNRNRPETLSSFVQR